MIMIEGVYKVFGDKPKLALEYLNQGQDKGSIYNEIAQIIAVQNVTLELKKHELFVIMGLSGSGKSTLLRCINRLVEPTLGQCFFKEDSKILEITSFNKKELRKFRRNHISMVFQNFALLPNRTALANVALGVEAQGRRKTSRLEIGMRMLDLMGLAEWKDSYPHQLSGGMQQRVGLARALATEAEVLLMDEPFSALDPLIRYNMQKLFIELQDRLKKTIFLVTHDLDEALRLGGRIAIMEDGHIVQVGKPEDIILNPKTEYVANFVKNADPTGVITVGSIALCIDENPDLFSKIETDNIGNEQCCLFSREGRRIFFYSNQNGRPVRAVIEGRSFPMQETRELNSTSDIGNIICAVREDMTIRDVMPIKVKSHLPVIVLSREGVFLGIVTEKELLQGFIKREKFFEVTKEKPETET
jgi:glycine betaine/proline transport system ATP-binding protein